MIESHNEVTAHPTGLNRWSVSLSERIYALNIVVKIDFFCLLINNKASGNKEARSELPE